jgi:hypothetical protein
MSATGGRKARVMYGANTIANIGEFSLSGFVPDLLESTSFGDTVKTYVRAGIDDAGEISFSGNYDPDDDNGQVALNALKTVTTGLTNLYFYDQYGAGAAGTTYSFWRVSSGGSIFLTKFNAVTMAKNSLGTVTFTGKVSGAALERVE